MRYKTYINSEEQILYLLLSIISDINVVVDDKLHKPIEINRLSCPFQMFLEPDVFTRHQNFLSIDLMHFVMEYVWYQFLFKFELEVILGSR